MRHSRQLILAVLLVLPARALAWDGPGMWWAPADGAAPGGGGIFGTGGAHDHGITCADCHVEQDERSTTRLDLTFTPALVSAGDVVTYEPGRKYDVDVSLSDLLRGPCGPYMANVNNFAASFEDPAGRTTGELATDSGQRQSACPAEAPRPDSAGTTGLYGDCEVIFSKGSPDRSRWSFSWTAPPAGTGAVRLFYGAVDGNCDMASMRDAVAKGTLDLAEPTARAPVPARPNARWALAGLVPALASLWARRRGRARR